MPEGPEVRRHAALLDAALTGHPIQVFSARTKAAKAWLADHPEAFEGQRVRQVRSHGKHLVGTVEENLFFHSHFMMWGSWRIVPVDDPLALTRDRRERARIVVPDAAALLFSAPVFTVGRGDPYAALPPLAALGPDILPYPDDGPFDAASFVQRLTAADHRETTIGAALLDQTIAAGIGNYLRAEILFLARLDPWRRVADLTEGDLDTLCALIPTLARRSYDHRRTVPAEVQARMYEDPNLVYTEPQPWNTNHFVFRRTNLPCLRCDDVVRQLHQVTRVLDDGEEKKRIIYFCPTCQGTTVPVKPPKRRPSKTSSA